MEVEEDNADLTYQLRIPDFSSYTGETSGSRELSCRKSLNIGSVTASFNIILNLFDNVSSFLNVDNHGKTKCVRFQQQKTPTKRGTNIVHGSPRLNNESPRFKKNTMQELYTHGGIEEIIYAQDSEQNHPKKISRTKNHAAYSPHGSPLGTTDGGDSCNVNVRVVCTETSVPRQLLQYMQIRTGIQDRPEQVRGLMYKSSSSGEASAAERSSTASEIGVWVGTLVPRISIKTYSLLQNGALNAWITFSIPKEMIPTMDPRDHLMSLSRDMKFLLEDGAASADALISTSDGDELPAHLAILRTRSSLLTSCKIMNESKFDIGIMVDGRSPASRKLISSNNKDYKNRHPEKSRYPPSVTETEEDTPSSGIGSAGNDSSSDSDIEEIFPEQQYSSPNNQRNVYINNRVDVIRTPTKQRDQRLQSPTRTMSSERLKSCRYPLSPLTKIHATPNSSSRKNYVKEKARISSDHDAVRDLNQCFIECNDTNNMTLATTINSKLDNTDESSCSSNATTIFDELKENFDNLHVNRNCGKHATLRANSSNNCGKVRIKVNMSTSVTKQFLEWIYTGSCSNLAGLSRPLLVAGRRHGVPALACAAQHHLAAGLEPSTLPGILLLAHTHQAFHLLQRALEYARDNAQKVTGSSNWEKTVKQCPELAVKLSRMMT